MSEVAAQRLRVVMVGGGYAGSLAANRLRQVAADGACGREGRELVAVPRYRCDTVGCGRAVFNQDLGKLASPRSSTTRRCARYVLRRLMIDRTTIWAIAAEPVTQPACGGYRRHSQEAEHQF